MNAFVAHVARLKKWDRSGRKMDAALNALNAPKRTYWAKILANTQAMTTQDIATLAKYFNMTPYALIEMARAWDTAGQPSLGFMPGVGTHDEDYEISADPGAGYRQAAETPREPR